MESIRPKPDATIFRRLRNLALYAGLLGAVAALVVASRVSAELSEKSLQLGAKLDQFAALSGTVTRLTWNGQTFSVSTRLIEEPIERVLGGFVVLCSQGTPRLATELASELGPSTGIAAGMFQRLLVLRDRPSDERGTGVCLAGLGDGGLAGLAARAQAFATSWDVSDLGQLRYTFLRKTARGTHVILVSADGPLVLTELIPMDGRDVAGPDVVPGVRPRSSTRIIAAAAHGTPHLLNAYHVNASAQVALADYGAQLESAGYRAFGFPKSAGDLVLSNGVLSRAYVRDRHALVTTSQPDESGSLLAVVQLDPQPAKAAR